jgi:hypothetical protein
MEIHEKNFGFFQPVERPRRAISGSHPQESWESGFTATDTVSRGRSGSRLHETIGKDLIRRDERGQGKSTARLISNESAERILPIALRQVAGIGCVLARNSCRASCC